MVYRTPALPGRRKEEIEERLAMLDRRVFSPRAGAPYDPSKPWIENALAEHGRRPFRAIVADTGPGQGIVDANTVDDRNELWRVDSGAMLMRQPAALADALALLLVASTRVVIVDPFFRADQPDKTAPLAAFCAALAGSGAAVEVHFGDNPRSYVLSMADAARYLPLRLPAGFRVTLRCWRERAGGARLHNRYLLTDIGGVQFGDSIEVGDPGHEDRVSILDERSHGRLWGQYLERLQRSKRLAKRGNS